MQQAAFKTQLDVNHRQATYFAKACGISRFCWNWALAAWHEQYRLFKTGEIAQAPDWITLKKQLNAIKKEQFPWMVEVTKYAAQQPFQNLGRAWQNFFKRGANGKVGAPQFKKKGKSRESFYVGGDQVKVKDGNLLWIPRLGWVRMRENLRFQGHINSIVVAKKIDKWQVSFSMKVEIQPLPCKSQARCGVDVGISHLATLSQGQQRYWPNPKAYQAVDSWPDGRGDQILRPHRR